MTKKKKKLGYSQYENLLANAHQKLDFLASKYQELQTYFIGYVEFHGENIAFHDWMEARINEMEAETGKNNKVMEEQTKESLIKSDGA
jgi:hypothetical protein|tara:strand:- start:1638 stop:1901 length:264 start_codon:yes stop_codon:yes gene_type:complete